MDDTMMPKIADFDLSRLMSQEKSRTVTAKLQGTPGYMAPECIEQRSISFEADIFSLGVIIIEIITGRRDYPNISETFETSLKHYTDKVVGSWRNRLIEITPVHMSPEMCIQQVQQCISVALKCLEHESNKRPTSLDIIQILNAVEPKCTSPGNPPNSIEKGYYMANIQAYQFLPTDQGHISFERELSP
ncbi:hypothetical protein SORBI_3002G013900 [Sorghum bicolor]|uniref:Protein kinase domain-containing protein n=1 Tax=Sorghum bicolor TaxID=4558 RepID=A0A1B6Q8Q3_SORBI|nr:hypothetical protein SORBI_3002G013900 [Sorghum bicolor]